MHVDIRKRTPNYSHVMLKPRCLINVYFNRRENRNTYWYIYYGAIFAKTKFSSFCNLFRLEFMIGMSIRRSGVGSVVEILSPSPKGIFYPNPAFFSIFLDAG